MNWFQGDLSSTEASPPIAQSDAAHDNEEGIENGRQVQAPRGVKVNVDHVSGDPNPPIFYVLLRKLELSDEAEHGRNRIEEGSRVLHLDEVTIHQPTSQHSGQRQNNPPPNRRSAHCKLGTVRSALEPPIPAEESKNDVEDLKKRIGEESIPVEEVEKYRTVENPNWPVPDVLENREPNAERSSDKGQDLLSGDGQKLTFTHDAKCDRRDHKEDGEDRVLFHFTR